MMSQQQELSPASRQVMSRAKSLARHYMHEFITTEHVLLSILECDKPCRGIEIIQELDVNIKEFSSFVMSNLSKYKGDKKPELKDIEPSARVLKVITYAGAIADEMEADMILVDHLLLSILVSDAGSGNNLFRLKNIDVNLLYEMIYIEILPKKRKRKQNNTPEADIAERESPAGMYMTGDQPEEEPTILDKVAVNMTYRALTGELDPVIGRDFETENVIQILSRRTKNNPVLIGEPGVGKTAVVECLAQRVAQNDVPIKLRNKQIYSLDVAQLVAGTMYRGQFEERLKEVINHVQSRDDVIIFIDEIHMIVGAGAGTSTMDVSNILKPALARGEFSCIGATTLQEYKESIESDGALDRRFQTVYVDEPDDTETMSILKGIKHKYEQYHNVKYNAQVLDEIIRCCSRYMHDKQFPDKAIDVLDELGARVSVKQYHSDSSFRDTIKQVQSVIGRKERAVETQQFDLALSHRETEHELISQLEYMIDERNRLEQQHIKPSRITCDQVRELVSDKTGIPVISIGDDEATRVSSLERRVNKLVLGQDSGVNKICGAIKRSRAGVSDPDKPICSLLFLGPTGVGKTHLARTLADEMFDGDNFKQFDMSEYSESHSISKLIGSPPGYVGYGEGGRLTEFVRHNPYCVLLFDEIEKAHSDVLQVFLQLLEYGQVTDSDGIEVNFKNTIVIMTSNIGAHRFGKKPTVGFQQTSVEDPVIEELKKQYAPEFVNRIDELVVFDKLTKQHMLQVTKHMLNTLKTNIRKNAKKRLIITNQVSELLASRLTDMDLGARPMRRMITDMIETPLADKIIDNHDHKQYTIDVRDDQVIILPTS